MKNRLRFIFLLTMVPIFANAQQSKTIQIELEHVIGNSKLLNLDSTFVLYQKDTFKIHTLRYYISGIELYKNKQVVFSEKNSFHLIDLSLASSLKFSLMVPAALEYDGIKFNLGIDSVTNTSGALGGALDPSKGMYWSWQSGYINLKIEGQSNRISTNNQQFQLHLGGYADPYLALQTISLQSNNENNICIQFDLEQWLSKIPLVNQHHIMSPSNAAVLISTMAAQAFSICTTSKR